jgi:hypothetical protein
LGVQSWSLAGYLLNILEALTALSPFWVSKMANCLA